MQQSLEAVQLEIERASEVVETGLEWSEVASESWRGAELCDQVIAVCWHVGPTGGQNRQNVRGDAFVQLCFVPSQAPVADAEFQLRGAWFFLLPISTHFFTFFFFSHISPLISMEVLSSKSPPSPPCKSAPARHTGGRLVGRPAATYTGAFFSLLVWIFTFLVNS